MVVYWGESVVNMLKILAWHHGCVVLYVKVNIKAFLIYKCSFILYTGGIFSYHQLYNKLRLFVRLSLNIWFKMRKIFCWYMLSKTSQNERKSFSWIIWNSRTPKSSENCFLIFVKYRKLKVITSYVRWQCSQECQGKQCCRTLKCSIILVLKVGFPQISSNSMYALGLGFQRPAFHL